MSHFDNMQARALDARLARSEGARIMTRTLPIIALVAVAALAGCNNSDHNIVAGGPVDDTSNVAANANVQLPPSITSSKSYRCGDNSIVYVDWMSDGSARVKKKRDEVGTSVTPGTDLKGDPSGSSISYKGQSCKA
jgi:hypothetical protein